MTPSPSKTSQASSTQKSSSPSHAVINPGSVVGVLGSGQLGRMFTIAARRLGYRVHTYSPETDTPTGQVADMEIVGSYQDLPAVEKFASQVDVMTFEFENVPAATAEAAAKHTTLRPAGRVLHTTQHRVREKTFLRDAGVPVTPFALVHSLDELTAAAKSIGLPGVLKTAGWGYDGKGQAKVNTLDDLSAAWKSLDTQEAVLEKLVNFKMEMSVVAARGADGSIVDYDVIENMHANHILDVSLWPARIDPAARNKAIDIAHDILTKLEVVGVMCVELFLTHDDQVLVNELAPRPHNSGHLTIESHVSCQFEQQVRAVCGLPLGSTQSVAPACAMANLLGDVWSDGEPDWVGALSDPSVKLHLYGKAQARPGRKMGHLTAVASTGEEAIAAVVQARDTLARKRIATSAR